MGREVQTAEVETRMANPPSVDSQAILEAGSLGDTYELINIAFAPGGTATSGMQCPPITSAVAAVCPSAPAHGRFHSSVL